MTDIVATAEKTQTPECVICAEKYTEKSAATCVYCQYVTCRTCVRTYALNETITQCMNCKKPWAREHQNAILKPSFVNGELKKHMEQVMFDRERAQFPATMSVIEDRRLSQMLSHERNVLVDEIGLLNATERLEKTKIREITALKQSAKYAPKMHPQIVASKMDADIAEHNQACRLLQRKQFAKKRRLDYINRLFQLSAEQRRIIVENQIDGAEPEDILHTMQTMAGDENASSRRHFVRACPIETCRGFLSTQWKCGLCGVHTCSSCHVPKTADKDAEHTCNPDDVATAELLAKDTRPCPKCGTGIFKIDGCDQMWCIECHSAFSWITGRLEVGHVHNPHFFEYQRRIGANTRNILDMPCNALNPDRYHGIIYHLTGNMFNRNTKKARAVKNMPIISNELETLVRCKPNDVAMSLQVFTTLLQMYRQDAIQNNLELRVRYLTEEISETQFRSNLFRESKKFNVEREIGQVIQTVVFAMTDILTRLVDYLRSNAVANEDTNMSDPNVILANMSEVDSLMVYANECLAKICVEYKIVRAGLFLRDMERKQQAAGLYSVKIISTADGDRIEPTTQR